MDTIKLIATSTFGLEAIVKRELQNLGFEQFTIGDGRVEFDAQMTDIPRVNLWLRTADRVLLKLSEFSATDFDQLFDQVKMLPWDRWLPQDAKITVLAKTVKSKLESARSNQSIVKKAILTRLQQKYNIEEFPETGHEYTIRISLNKDIVQVTLDTSGDGLHKRGYRKGSGEVPLRENLAAAMVLLSFWDKDRLLIDPFCGSGTILIEAALIGRNIAPGLNRTFAAEHWSMISEDTWLQARDTATAQMNEDVDIQIFGYDIDPERIKDSQANAKKAGVAENITFAQKDINDLWIDQQYGIIITNPPYGVKLGNLKELSGLYVTLNKMFRKKKGWSVYLLTADKRFPDFFKRAKPDKVRKLFSGTLEVNFYQYFGAKKTEN